MKIFFALFFLIFSVNSFSETVRPFIFNLTENNLNIVYRECMVGYHPDHTTCGELKKIQIKSKKEVENNYAEIFNTMPHPDPHFLEYSIVQVVSASTTNKDGKIIYQSFFNVSNEGSLIQTVMEHPSNLLDSSKRLYIASIKDLPELSMLTFDSRQAVDR